MIFWRGGGWKRFQTKYIPLEFLLTIYSALLLFNNLIPFKVHLIEKQEMKRQVLKQRAERTAKAEDEADINWDDDEEDVPIPGSKPFVFN